MKKSLTVYYLLALIGSFLCLNSSAMFEEHIILDDFDGGCALAGAHFNEDSFIDFVATSYDGDYISWFENNGNQLFTEHLVEEGFESAKAVDTADFDQDGDTDFVATSDHGNCIAWFENDGSGNFTRHDLITDWVRPSFVLARNNFLGTNVDINSDSHTDIIAISCQNDKFGWLENDGNANFTLHMIKENWDVVTAAIAYDFNNDSHMDLIATAKANGGEITLFLNNGNNTFTEQIIFTDWDAPNSIQVADINNDGNMDFAATSCGNSDAVGWFENDGNLNFTPHILKTAVNGSRGMTVWDIDMDSDIDIFSIGWESADAYFFENKGDHLQERLLCDGTAYDLLKFFVADIDNDNDPDLFASGYDDGQLRWFESLNEFLETDIYAQPLTGHAPLSVNFQDDSQARPANTSWSWDFTNNGSVDTAEMNPTYVYNQPGMYSVSLESSNGLFTDSITKEDYIRVFNGESAMEFNGSSGFCHCSATESLALTESFTLEAWIYPLDWGENAVFGGKIFDKTAVVIFLCESYSTLNPHSIGVRLDTQTDSYSYASSGENSVVLNQWQYISISYDTATAQIKIFINDQLQEIVYTNVPVGNISDNANTDIYIGNNNANQHTFDGYLDEIRLWNIVRSDNDILANSQCYLIGTEPGLIAYWRMNEGNGNSIEDISTFDHSLDTYNCLWIQGTNFDFSPVDDCEQSIPDESINLKIYPNPIHLTEKSKRIIETKISFTLDETQFIAISLYNLKGQKVTDIFTGFKEKGTHILFWNTNKQKSKMLSSGIYLIKLQTPERYHFSRVTILK